MQSCSNISQSLFSYDNIKCVEVNNCPQLDQNKFIAGLQNARSLLKNLKRSISKTAKYERKLIQCKSSHGHSHNEDAWESSDQSVNNESQAKERGIKDSRSRLDLTESWSTMSIVCLQYQYEELSKRYESLLKAYNERCDIINARDASLERMRQRIASTHAQLTDANEALIAVGNKFLGLKEKRLAQKIFYKEKIGLKSIMLDVVSAAEKARFELDTQLKHSMSVERDAATAMLLAEIRKCNMLCLENLRLKANLQEFKLQDSCVWDSITISGKQS